MPNRREFIQSAAIGTALLPLSYAFAGRKPPSEEAAAYQVILPAFMGDIINERDITYLNETIPALYDTHREWLPALDAPPQYIVLNTLTDTLVHHGHVVIAGDVIGEEALTLFEAQYLLVTTRFGSVATPHRGADVNLYGRWVYLKQHPQAGYRTPEPLLLEEMLHTQQDVTVMRGIIEREELNPVTCLHAQLKGISELGAQYYIENLTGEPDYVFVLDDGTHCESAVHAVQQLATRLGTDEATFLRAISFDTTTYAKLDQTAMTEYDAHIWQMVTTWRFARDAEGNATDIAPAFQPY